MKRYVIEIDRVGDGFEMRLRSDGAREVLAAGPAALGPVAVAGAAGSLGEVVQRLLTADPKDLLEEFDERTQLDLGRHLYTETFGQLQRGAPKTNRNIEVAIGSDDEFINRLPWVLLVQGELFLASCGWSIALDPRGVAAGEPRRAALLPPSPRILVAAPEPQGANKTHAAAHLEDLERLLASADPHFERGRHLQVAKTWEEFQRQAEENPPEIVYYYGHGLGDARTARLAFADADGGRFDVPIAEVAHALRHRPPVLAYINACHGDAGGLLGAGRQLGQRIPAVVTNRTVAFVETAQRQAHGFWRSVLLEGKAPHQSIHEARTRREGSADGGFRDARWMTPVLYRSYGAWESHPPKPRDVISDAFWHLKLDRVPQFSQVQFQTQKMLHLRRPAGLGYLWYGEAGQGIDIFHQRLGVELKDFLGENRLFEVRPRWPDVLGSDFGSLEDMMLEAFNVTSLDDIAGRVRGWTRGQSGRDILVYVRHRPLVRGDLFEPRQHLGRYLEWWDREFLEVLKAAPAFGLLGISFEVKNPPEFQRMIEDLDLDRNDRPNLVFEVLDELERLRKKHLRDFLRTHKIVLPSDFEDQVLDDILKQTRGHYELTLEALRQLVSRAWKEAESRSPTAENDSVDYDW